MSGNPIRYNDPTGHQGDDGCGAYGCHDDSDPTPSVPPTNPPGDDEECNDPDCDLATDKPSFAICIAGGVMNREGDQSGTGTELLCEDLQYAGKIDGFVVLGNYRSDWGQWWHENSALYADYNLIIVGYSMGGSAAMEFAYYLDNANRDVSYLFLIDPVISDAEEHDWATDYLIPGLDQNTVPDNVGHAYLFREVGKETIFLEWAADLAAPNNKVYGVDAIYYFPPYVNHGNIDELSGFLVAELLP